MHFCAGDKSHSLGRCVPIMKTCMRFAMHLSGSCIFGARTFLANHGVAAAESAPTS